MKKFLSLFLISVMLIGMTACSSAADLLIDGDYIMQGDFDEGTDIPTMLLDLELMEFLLSPGDYGEFADYGTFTVDGDVLTATSHGNVYTFRVEGGALLVYEGAQTTKFIDIPVGSKFVYETEAPPLAGNFGAACVN